MTWPIAVTVMVLVFLVVEGLAIRLKYRNLEAQRAHERALHDANAAVRQEAFGSLMKRAEAAETEMQRLTEKVTTLQNRVGRA
jgi:hypothetical protein